MKVVYSADPSLPVSGWQLPCTPTLASNLSILIGAATTAAAAAATTAAAAAAGLPS